jgi:hypothetical protein
VTEPTSKDASEAKTRTIPEQLIDCEEDWTLQAVPSAPISGEADRPFARTTSDPARSSTVRIIGPSSL